MDVTEISTVIAAMGTSLGPDILAQCRSLFAAEQVALADGALPVAVDCVYGPDPRNRLDLYGAPPHGPAPVVLFVHGGGFLHGDKGGAGDQWPNAHIGRWAARQGWLGAVMNYRLAPDHAWPSGAQDVVQAIAWLRNNVAEFGGDPARIVLMGTSAGSVHCAGAMALHADLPLAGVVLLSGLYGYTPLEDRDTAYYGDLSLYPQRMPRDAVVGTHLPLMVACAQFDPPRFQAEFVGLLQERLKRHGTLPRATISSGHNHYSMPMHLGTSDQRLADEICDFVRETTANV